jgi:hypothetical protein
VHGDQIGPQPLTLGEGQKAEVLHLATRGTPSTVIHCQASPWGSHARSVCGGRKKGVQAAF